MLTKMRRLPQSCRRCIIGRQAGSLLSWAPKKDFAKQKIFWEKGEKALSWQSHGVALTAFKLGNGALCASFPDRARALPREKSRRKKRSGCRKATARICALRRRGRKGDIDCFTETREAREEREAPAFTPSVTVSMFHRTTRQFPQEGAYNEEMAQQPLRLAFCKPPSRRRKENAASVRKFSHNGKFPSSQMVNATPWRCQESICSPLTQGRLKEGFIIRSRRGRGQIGRSCPYRDSGSCRGGRRRGRSPPLPLFACTSDRAPRSPRR